MKYVALSEKGKVRKINQDSIFAASGKNVGLFIVADGMGGHSQGEKASQLIVRRMSEWWETFQKEKNNSSFMQIMNSLKKTAKEVNEEIYQVYNKEDICGSTMVLLFICKNAYGIISAGDSRIYLYHRWKFRQMTIDEVWENQPALTPLERKNNWDRCHGRLYNAVGIRKEMQFHIVTDQWKTGMIFLICSDGLYKYCQEKFLIKCMRKARVNWNLQISVDALLSKVYEQDAEDNISLILVKT